MGLGWKRAADLNSNRHALKCFSIAAPFVALLLATSASPAAASVTVGQIAPDTTAPRTCVSPVDRVQPTVTGGSSYIMPVSGTITSWSTTTSGDGGGQLKLKVFRQVAGTTYMAVGHDSPRDLTLNTINTFSTSVAVRAGDLLGLNSFSGTPDCAFLVTGETYLRLPGTGDLADGESADFTGSTIDRRLNVSAVLDPSNKLTFGRVVRNKRKGTATLTLDVPNPGQLEISGTGAKVVQTAAVTTVPAAGPVKFKIKATGKKRAKLNETGKVKVRPTFTFTPTGGTANVQSTKVKLKKKL